MRHLLVSAVLFVWCSCGQEVTPKAGAAAVATPATNRVYVTGGISESEGTRSKDLSVWNSLTREFEDKTGGWPAMSHARSSHVSVAHGDCVYVHGGGSGVVECFNVSSEAWQVASAVGLDRTGAASALDGNLWYVFGGLDSQGSPTNSLFAFDMNTRSWATIAPSSAAAPSARAWSSMDVVVSSGGQRTLLLFGGLASGVASSELWAMTISTRQWTNQAQAPTWPAPRYGHASRAFSGALLVALGESSDHRDLWSWDWGLQRWTRNPKQASDVAPSRRVLFASAESGSGIDVFGGAPDAGSAASAGDIWHLDAPSLSWSRECFPGFVFEPSACAPDASACQLCHSCGDHSGVTRNYVSDILSGRRKGVLRQCPACWRLDNLAQQK